MPFKSTLPLRFWRKLYALPSGCWEWQGKLTPEGYGCEGDWFTLAHWLAYEALKGPIPEGLEIDHLCRNRACVNPTHLEAVTHRVNLLRGNAPSAQAARRTHCDKGHPFDLLNTFYVRDEGTKYRRCRTCKNEAWQRWKKKRKTEGRWPRYDARYPKKVIGVS